MKMIENNTKRMNEWGKPETEKLCTNDNDDNGSSIPAK